MYKPNYPLQGVLLFVQLLYFLLNIDTTTMYLATR